MNTCEDCINACEFIEDGGRYDGHINCPCTGKEVGRYKISGDEYYHDGCRCELYEEAEDNPEISDTIPEAQLEDERKIEKFLKEENKFMYKSLQEIATEDELVWLKPASLSCNCKTMVHTDNTESRGYIEYLFKTYGQKQDKKNNWFIQASRFPDYGSKTYFQKSKKIDAETSLLRIGWSKHNFGKDVKYDVYLEVSKTVNEDIKNLNVPDLI